MWAACRDVIFFWITRGIRTFRIDNPHTKPFAFWEWVIAEVKAEHPDVVFLSEAFTRPKVMYRLAKLGFSQSYTYFAWRNTKQELTEYLTERTRTGGASCGLPPATCTGWRRPSLAALARNVRAAASCSGGNQVRSWPQRLGP